MVSNRELLNIKFIKVVSNSELLNVKIIKVRSRGGSRGRIPGFLEGWAHILDDRALAPHTWDNRGGGGGGEGGGASDTPTPFSGSVNDCLVTCSVLL